MSCHLYCGFRGQASFEPYREALTRNKDIKKLHQLRIAYSQEGEKKYVSNLLTEDAGFIADTLTQNGTLMICGSLSMHNDVIELLELICRERTGKSLSFYQSHGQVVSECY